MGILREQKQLHEAQALTAAARDEQRKRAEELYQKVMGTEMTEDHTSLMEHWLGVCMAGRKEGSSAPARGRVGQGKREASSRERERGTEDGYTQRKTESQGMTLVSPCKYWEGGYPILSLVCSWRSITAKDGVRGRGREGRRNRGGRRGRGRGRMRGGGGERG